MGEYNFKSNELLQITDFCCEHCLAIDILDTLDKLREFESLEVYAKAELVEELFKILSTTEINGQEIKLGMINFDGVELDYNDVYCLSLSDNYTLWIEPAYRLNEKTSEVSTFNSEATLAYVYQEDCDQDLLDQLEKNKVATLLFGFEEIE